MKLLDQKQLREYQLGILNYFADFCNANGIKYWINYGTLIGAVRHKGYIPWDDDIDVSMFRDDYEKLIKTFNKLSDGRYKFLCPENDRTYYYPFGKIIDTRTVLYEMGKNGLKLGVYMDVFVYDNAPIDEKKFQKMLRKRDFYGRLRKYQLPLKPMKINFKRMVVLIIRMFLKIVPKSYFNRQIAKLAKRYKEIDTGQVYWFIDPYDKLKCSVEHSMFDEVCDVEFEGRKYKAPKRYDEWLRICYGDYMKLPSEEERILRQHDIEAYSLE